jgi:hypothetical protein
MTQNNFSSNNFDMVTKNAEFDAEFEYVEKEAKKFIQRKLQVTICTQYCKVKKYIITTLSCN